MKELEKDTSVNIMKSAEAKNYPDVITFGFFCRKSNIERLKNSYIGKLEGRIARGVSFHIAPSNVPVNFTYSMISALLAGNSCIVRASSKLFRQIGRCAVNIIDAENKALGEVSMKTFAELKKNLKKDLSRATAFTPTL